ncbi:MAG: PEP-CTERM sorting domain-containing protein [Phycisphaerales bacterium]|nr:PEP-CTERM sorting domain-containing protein [Phycisphaerales bacterium]MCB9856329.1 PEP-CTERM sorting domain-containing protein [Phycisphaerales bacterium]
MKRHWRGTLPAILVIALGVRSAAASVFPETEGNDSKAAANVVSGILAGDSITGTSTSSSGAGIDTFRVQTGALAPAIYRHRLTLTTAGTAGHTGSIRGLTQSAGVISATDTALQTSSSTTTPARFNQWYGFGSQEEIYYRVTGTSSTTMPYSATLTSEVIVPLDLGSIDVGSIAGGNLTITSVGQTGASQTDTDLVVLDSNFQGIAGYLNDDEIGPTAGSVLTRLFTPGVYYVAISNWNLANSLASPVDDDFRSGNVLDFAGAIADSSTTANLNVSFSINGGLGGNVPAALTKVGAFDIAFAKFTVVPEPATLSLLGFGVMALIRRRR